MAAARADIKYWARRAVPWAVLAAVAWLVFSNLHEHTLLRSGSGAPTLRTQLSDGKDFELSAQRGKVVVVNFWSTTCPPCRKEAPVLTRAHRELDAEGGLVVGLSVDRGSLEQVARAARELGMDYPIGLGSPEALERFRVSALPTTYVIAPDGTVVRSIVGAASHRQLAEAIAEARGQTG